MSRHRKSPGAETKPHSVIPPTRERLCKAIREASRLVNAAQLLPRPGTCEDPRKVTEERKARKPRMEDEDASRLCELVPNADCEQLLAEVVAIVEAWGLNIERKRAFRMRPDGQLWATRAESPRMVRQHAQRVTLHADKLFAALQQLNVGEGEQDPLSALDYRRAWDPLFKIAAAACLIAPPTHKPETLVKFVTSLSTVLRPAQIKDPGRLEHKKPPNWPLGFAVAALVACFRRHNTMVKGAKARERRFTLCAIEASGLLPKARNTEAIVRDYLRKVRVDSRGFAEWQP